MSEFRVLLLYFFLKALAGMMAKEELTCLAAERLKVV
jgi:hypothetical protein